MVVVASHDSRSFRGFPLQELGTGNLVGNLARSCLRNQGPDLVPGLFYFTPRNIAAPGGLHYFNGPWTFWAFEEFLSVECSQCSVPAVGVMARRR